MTSPHDQSGPRPAKSPIEIAVEALRLSSSMLEAMQVQLCSWGHDPSVNVDGQRDKNTEAIAALSQPVAAEVEALIGKLERAAENKYLNSQSLVSVLRYSNIEETLEGKAAAMLRRLSLPVAGEGWRPIAEAPKDGTLIVAGYWTLKDWASRVCFWSDFRRAFQVLPDGPTGQFVLWHPLPPPPSSEPG